MEQLKALGIRSWIQFKADLTIEHWNSLYRTLNSTENYADLISNSACLVCEDNENQLIGMAFLVPQGNPTKIYDESWCHLRFVSVDPKYRNLGIGEKLTRMCIEIARNNNERTMALHTSEIMTGAIRIYERIGFKRSKEIEPSLGVRYWLYTFDL